MLERLCVLRDENRVRLQEASDLLGRDLLEHYRSSNGKAFAANRDVQVGVFLANHLFMESLAAVGVTADLSLGLSLGEYNHLVHIGCLDFAAALRLVEARGAAYDQGAEIAGGAMVAAFPISYDELSEVVARVRDQGVLEIANLNSPQQQVLSGERPALDAACAILADEFSVSPVIIEERVPMHSSRFRPVADLLRPALMAAPWRPAERPYLPNVLGSFIENPASDQIVDLLARHVYQPVLWRASVELIADRDPDAVFIEVGPRAVLSNLLSPRWRRVRRETTDNADNIVSHFALTTARLQALHAA